MFFTDYPEENSQDPKKNNFPHVILSEERAKNLRFGPVLRLKEETLRYRSE